ncbi:MAG: 3-methyl-2-oxobutanoate dehydrogenase subunit beta, partial [Duncaniella sp.]|nr:3-methyl-2-oxobutanoate dehydrogenase subunit beta [Duncaniella sp.]
EGISYIAAGELPALIVNCMRGGPGLGTIQPSQSDYFQACKGGGHGDYHLIVLAPASVQEMADFVGLGFDLAYKYRNPVMMLADGVIGQMMERVTLPAPRPRRTDEQIARECPWAVTGRPEGRGPNIMTTLQLDPTPMEKHNLHLQEKYRLIAENEVRFEEFATDDAEYLIGAFGCVARICQKAVEEARARGIKGGILRPITLWPFPEKEIQRLGRQVKGMLVVELNAGQMIEDVRLSLDAQIPVHHFGRMGGIVMDPDEVLVAFKEKFQL